MAPITVVSGLPRSGTSLMMQMLQAGGVPPMSDGQRTADDSNPRGYYEIEAIKRLKDDTSWLANAPGKAIKCIHLLLTGLPSAYEYRVLFMRRDMHEVVASQAAMLERDGKAGGQLSPEQLIKVYETQITKALAWVDQQPNMQRLDVPHRELFSDPTPVIADIAAFLEQDLDTGAMAAVIDPELYRSRPGQTA